VKLKCLAIDDEDLALDLLEDNIQKVPMLELIGRCSKATDAFDILRSTPVDLMFLDIMMPDITGIQLLNSLIKRPMVIITTAYSQYASEGFDLDVIDYLLKPYSFERFLKGVNKAVEYHNLRERSESDKIKSEQGSPANFLFVRADYKLVRINFNEILYIEGLKDYVKIYTGDKPVITQMSLKALEEKLPVRDFLRVHRSFIVAFDKIDFIQKNLITIGRKEIPVSEMYREQLFRIIHDHKTRD
jgi:DNA-binding LytR/AlgR family response regulator